MKLYIARDEGGGLYLYDDIPEKRNGYFIIGIGCDVMSIDDELFPEITFENSPQEVELKLVNAMASFAEDLHTKCKPLEGEFSKFVDDNFDELI